MTPQDSPYSREELEGLGEVNVWPKRGPVCGKCRKHIPQYSEMSPELDRQLRQLPPVEAMKQLQAVTGCPLFWAKIWVSHPHGAEPPSGPPCPSCGTPLRTAEAQQCFGCGADWHGEG